MGFFQFSNFPIFQREIVTLNVGGTIFQTTRKTLRKYPSRLQRLIDEDVKPTKDKNGNIFIDRDPKYFQKILNAMRDEKFNADMEKEHVDELKAEVEYYELEWLEKEICCYASGSKDVQLVRESDPVRVEWKEVEEERNGYRFLKGNSELMPILFSRSKAVIVYRYLKPARGEFEVCFRRHDFFWFVEKYRKAALFVFLDDGDSEDDSVTWTSQFYPSIFYSSVDSKRPNMVIRFWKALQENVEELDGEDYFERQQRILNKFYEKYTDSYIGVSYTVNLEEMNKTLFARRIHSRRCCRS